MAQNYDNIKNFPNLNEMRKNWTWIFANSLCENADKNGFFYIRTVYLTEQNNKPDRF